VYITKKFGVSLGHYIYLPSHLLSKELVKLTPNTVYCHEYGHTIQNYIFGWLYLIVIGIPSLVNNIRSRYNKRVLKTYYQRYPEKWADKLGGVKR
jgi:hypothetical protein